MGSLNEHIIRSFQGQQSEVFIADNLTLEENGIQKILIISKRKKTEL